MSCPFCGASESLILRSRGLVTDDRVGRRRQCAECGRRFPTSERLNREVLERELADEYPVAPAIIGPASVPVTWANADALVHRLWGQAKDREYVKRDWMALQHVLDGLRD